MLSCSVGKRRGCLACSTVFVLALSTPSARNTSISLHVNGIIFFLRLVRALLCTNLALISLLLRNESHMSKVHASSSGARFSV